MRIFVFLLLLFISVMPGMASFDGAMNNVRESCLAISDELNEMRIRAGVGTAVSAVGTVAGGVALGTGIAKANIDSDIKDWHKILQSMSEADRANGVVYSRIEQEDVNAFLEDFVMEVVAQSANIALAEAEQKSIKLGNVRTGTLATSTAANIAGAVAAGGNRVAGDLQQKINACIESVNELSRVRMQARLDGTVDVAQLSQAEDVIAECGLWETVNVESIDNRAKGATISSGIGAGLGLAGTITSASANSEFVRSGDDKKEKNLNTAANVLAGGTTLASGAATIFNATQITAIKRAAEVADACEEALR